MADAVYPSERPIATIEVIPNKPFWETWSRHAAINHCVDVAASALSKFFLATSRSLNLVTLFWKQCDKRALYRAWSCIPCPYITVYFLSSWVGGLGAG